MDLAEIFTNYGSVVIFLHVLSAVIWVGGMIAIRFAFHPSMQDIEDRRLKLRKIVDVTGKLFIIVFPFIFILLATAVIMLVGTSLHESTMAEIVSAKEIIWVIMSINFFIMVFRRRSAAKLLEIRAYIEAKDKLSIVSGFLLPLNIILGMVAIYLGVMLRGV